MTKRREGGTGKAPYADRPGTKQMPEGLNGRVRFPARRAHIASKDCWCSPIADYCDPDTGRTVWVHQQVQ